MGGALSCGQDNDDLVNILIVLGYIKSKNVERVFREVDRGDYVLPAHRDLAYKDLSWKIGNIHLSAPCVYGKVMEGLALKPGVSFLNIGSGTGYLSTMAGLILGENGTNHGIEMHEDCLAYAYEHLEAFKEKFLNTDGFEFCEPTFQLGNFLNVIPNRQYDRVYCGAACPEIHEQFVKQFVRVGGILVMPYKDHLLRIERINESTWRHHTMLPVSFAMLASPQEGNDRGLLHLPLCQPTTLQELCRGSIRRHLRKIVWSEHSDLERKTVIIPQSVVDISPSQLPPSPFGIPYLEELTPEAQRREVVSSTLQLVRAVVQPPQPNRRNTEDEQRDSDTSEDSDEVVDRFEVDLFELFRAQNESEGSTKEAETTETEMQEDYFEEAPPMIDEDDLMDAAATAKRDNSAAAKAATDSDMEADDSDQAESRFDRSFESRLKRRKSEVPASNNESNRSGDNKLYRLFGDSNIPEEAQNGRISGSCSPVAGASNSDDDDDDDDDDLNFALIKKAFSILKDKLDTKMEENSESDSSDSSCEETNGRDGNHRDTSVGAKRTSAMNLEGVRNADMTVDDDVAAGSLFTCRSNSQIEGGGSNDCIDTSHENKTDDLLSDKNCSNDDCSSPHNRRSVDRTSTNEISDNNIDTLSKARVLHRNIYQRYRSLCDANGSSGTSASQKRRSDQRSDRSGSKESSNLQSQSPNSASSNSLSDENDSDIDIRCLRGKKEKRIRPAIVLRLPVPGPVFGNLSPGLSIIPSVTLQYTHGADKRKLPTLPRKVLISHIFMGRPYVLCRRLRRLKIFALDVAERNEDIDQVHTDRHLNMYFIDRNY